VTASSAKIVLGSWFVRTTMAVAHVFQYLLALSTRHDVFWREAVHAIGKSARDSGS
jgi:hypothetical protein